MNRAGNTSVMPTVKNEGCFRVQCTHHNNLWSFFTQLTFMKRHFIANITYTILLRSSNEDWQIPNTWVYLATFCNYNGALCGEKILKETIYVVTNIRPPSSFSARVLDEKKLTHFQAFVQLGKTITIPRMHSKYQLLNWNPKTLLCK